MQTLERSVKFRMWNYIRNGVIGAGLSTVVAFPALADLPPFPVQTVAGIEVLLNGSYNPAGGLTVTGLPGTNYYETITGQYSVILNPPANDYPNYFSLAVSASYQLNSDPVVTILPPTSVSLNDIFTSGAPVTFSDLANGVLSTVGPLISDLITTFQTNNPNFACATSAGIISCANGGPTLFDLALDTPTGDLTTGLTGTFAVGVDASLEGQTVGPLYFGTVPATLQISGNLAVQAPEPASMAVLGMGLVGLGFVRRRGRIA